MLKKVKLVWFIVVFSNFFTLQGMNIMITMIMDMKITVMDMKIMVMDMDMMITVMAMMIMVMVMMIIVMIMGMEINMAIMRITNIQLEVIKIMVGDILIIEEMMKIDKENMFLSTMKILLHPNQKRCQSHIRVLKMEITFNCSPNMVFNEINFNHFIIHEF